jgi:hypothetical protein
VKRLEGMAGHSVWCFTASFLQSALRLCESVCVCVCVCVLSVSSVPCLPFSLPIYHYLLSLSLSLSLSPCFHFFFLCTCAAGDICGKRIGSETPTRPYLTRRCVFMCVCVCACACGCVCVGRVCDLPGNPTHMPLPFLSNFFVCMPGIRAAWRLQGLLPAVPSSLRSSRWGSCLVSSLLFLSPSLPLSFPKYPPHPIVYAAYVTMDSNAEQCQRHRATLKRRSFSLDDISRWQ